MSKSKINKCSAIYSDGKTYEPWFRARRRRNRVRDKMAKESRKRNR